MSLNNTGATSATPARLLTSGESSRFFSGQHPFRHGHAVRDNVYSTEESSASLNLNDSSRSHEFASVSLKTGSSPISRRLGTDTTFLRRLLDRGRELEEIALDIEGRLGNWMDNGSNFDTSAVMGIADNCFRSQFCPHIMFYVRKHKIARENDLHLEEPGDPEHLVTNPRTALERMRGAVGRRHSEESSWLEKDGYVRKEQIAQIFDDYWRTACDEVWISKQKVKVRECL